MIRPVVDSLLARLPDGLREPMSAIVADLPDAQASEAIKAACPVARWEKNEHFTMGAGIRWGY